MTTSVNHTNSPEINTPLDWRTIDTSTPDGLKALDYYIGYRLGYRVVKRPTGYGDDYWRLEAPDGSYHGAGSEDPAEAPFTSRNNRNSPGANPDLYLKCFSTDVQDALTLVPDRTSGIEFTLTRQFSRDHQNDWLATFTNYFKNVSASSSTPALAICDAWCIFDGMFEWDAPQQPHSSERGGGE